jgi:PleD family two-component response regulator
MIADRLREAVGRLPVPVGGGATLAVSVSGGLVALEPESALGLAEALEQADAALYAAKVAGRNRIAPALNAPAFASAPVAEPAPIAKPASESTDA